MGRTIIPIDDDRQLVVGIDRPMHTLYLQLWDRNFDADWDFGAPAKAAGYHDAEKEEPLAGEYGDYPLGFAGFDRTLQEWGLSDEIRERAGAALAGQEETPGELLGLSFLSSGAASIRRRLA